LLFKPDGRGLDVVVDGILHACSSPYLLPPEAKAMPGGSRNSRRPRDGRQSGGTRTVPARRASGDTWLRSLSAIQACVNRPWERRTGGVGNEDYPAGQKPATA